MTKDEALKMALEALEHEADVGNDDAYRRERDAIREALAQQPAQGEPMVDIGGKMKIDASAPLVLMPHPAFKEKNT